LYIIDFITPTSARLNATVLRFCGRCTDRSGMFQQTCLVVGIAGLVRLADCWLCGVLLRLELRHLIAR
jgi:hypothetical protein